MTDLISVGEYETVLIIGSKRRSTGNSIKQCLPSLKDPRDVNSGGAVYGSVTSGQLWMFRYDETSFLTTNSLLALFETMEMDKNRTTRLWWTAYSVH